MNTILKWFSPNMKTQNSAKMDQKNISTTQPFRRMALIAILVVFCAVIYTYYLSNNKLISNKLKNDIKKSSSKQQFNENEIKSDFETISPKPVQKPKDFISTALLLEEISGLSLDDFEPINKENVNELKLSDISTFNNLHLGPRIQSIVRMDYFKYVKLNLQRGCTLWPDSSKCSLK
jgi:hypothetical protein